MQGTCAMKVATVVVLGLIATNIATVGYIGAEMRSAPKAIRADRVEGLRVRTEDGTLDVKLSDTVSGESVVLSLTPHSTLQLHDQLGQMIALIEKTAAEKRARQPRQGASAPSL